MMMFLSFGHFECSSGTLREHWGDMDTIKQAIDIDV